jgi:hypothetical protein
MKNATITPEFIRVGNIVRSRSDVGQQEAFVDCIIIDASQSSRMAVLSRPMTFLRDGKVEVYSEVIDVGYDSLISNYFIVKTDGGVPVSYIRNS